MKFAIGDQVVHPTHGVGTIKSLSEQQFVGTQSRQFYEVAMAKATVWVPVSDSNTSILRSIAPKQLVNECRHLLSSEPVPFDGNRALRQAEIADRMKGGLLPALSRTVRDLRARGWVRPLSAAEDILLAKLSKALAEEWAAAIGVTTAGALREIEGLLRKGRLTYMPETADEEPRPARVSEWS